METVFSAAMRHATKLTRAQNVIEATRVIQRALSGLAREFSPDQQAPESPRLITPPTNGAQSAHAFDADAFEQPRRDAGTERSRSRASTAEQAHGARMKRPLGEVLTLLRQANLPNVGHGPTPFAKSRHAPAPVRKGPPISREPSPARRVPETTSSTSPATRKAGRFPWSSCSTAALRIPTTSRWGPK